MTSSANRRLPFNTSKCKYMHIFKNNPADSYSYYPHTQNKGNVDLVSVCEKNDLGICFDSAVKFGKHINNKIKTGEFNRRFDSQNIPILRYVYLYCYTKLW